MAERFDVLGFIRDLGDRSRAKKLIEQNRAVLASGNPDAIAAIVAQDPQNPHVVSAVQNMFGGMGQASNLKTASSGRDLTGAQTRNQDAGTRNQDAGTVDLSEVTAGRRQSREQQGEQYNWMKQGRDAAVSAMPGGMPNTPEAVQALTQMLNQYTSVGQGESNVDLTRANTGRVQAETGQVQGSEQRANVNQQRQITGENAFANLVNIPDAGPLAGQIGNLQLGQGQLGVQRQQANENERSNRVGEGQRDRQVGVMEREGALKNTQFALDQLTNIDSPFRDNRTPANRNNMVDLIETGSGAKLPTFRTAQSTNGVYSPQSQIANAAARMDAKNNKVTPAQAAPKPGGAMNPQNLGTQPQQPVTRPRGNPIISNQTNQPVNPEVALQTAARREQSNRNPVDDVRERIQQMIQDGTLTLEQLMQMIQQ